MIVAQADLFGADTLPVFPSPRRQAKKKASVEAFNGGEIQYRPYQTECVEACIEAFDQGVTRQVCSLSTGAGKTVMIGLLIKQMHERAVAMGKAPGQVLVLAHRKELVVQNAEKIKWVNPELEVQVEQASLHADAAADVISASVATLGRKGSERIKKLDPANFMAVVVDEVHHAAADSYQRILIDHFKTNEPDSEILVSGWSATVRRADGKGLEDIFDEIVYHKGIQEFIEEKWLCRLRGVRVSTDTDISAVATLAGDFNQGQLEDAVNTPTRNAVLYNAWKTHAHDAGRHSTLVFCVDRAHAHDVRETFRINGVPAEMILGNTHPKDREAILKRFANREIPVLINVGVMTEGTDVPCIDTILMARPTQSSPLYIQIIGRGLRLYEGKEDCLVVDLVDVCQNHSLMTVPVLFGLNQDFDAEGGDLIQIADRVNEMAEDNGAVANATTLAEAERIVSEDFDPFSTMRPPDDIQAMSELKWFQTGQDRYRADIKGGETKRGHIEVRADALGHWEVIHHKPGGEEVMIRRRNNVDIAFQAADAFIKEHYRDGLSLMAKAQNWHEDPWTQPQQRLLRKIGAWLPEAPPDNMTKGQAAECIDRAFKLMNAAKKKNRRAVPPKRVDDVKVGKI